jgi:Holliday junction resolvase RusA-like endonuclease
MNDVVLTVMGRVPSWNSHLSKSGWRYSAAAEDWTKRVHHALLGAGLGAVRLTGPLVVHVIRFGSPVLDVDNVMAKVVVDGMKHAGLIEDDHPGVVQRLVVESVKAKHKDARVEVKLSKVDG